MAGALQTAVLASLGWKRGGNVTARGQRAFTHRARMNLPRSANGYSRRKRPPEPLCCFNKKTRPLKIFAPSGAGFYDAAFCRTKGEGDTVRLSAAGLPSHMFCRAYFKAVASADRRAGCFQRLLPGPGRVSAGQAVPCKYDTVLFLDIH